MDAIVGLRQVKGDVLLGIEPKDWPKIRQVVVVMHNSVKKLPEVAAKLERQVFRSLRRRKSMQARFPEL